jgi:hypothetical protein
MPGDDYAANDSLMGTLFLNSPIISSFPYREEFESNNGNWTPTGTASSWAWGTPAKTNMNRAANGNKCWATSLTANYNDGEYSALLSPCFDLSGMTQPVLSFSHIYMLENGFDFSWVEYSTDGGSTWTKLGVRSSQAPIGIIPPAIAGQAVLPNGMWPVTIFRRTQPICAFRILMSADGSVNYEGRGR